jgi:outer membrane immunogenic protein
MMALTTATAAFAADLPPNVPAKMPAAPAQFSWTGCYIGGHLGGAFRGLTKTNDPTDSTTHNSAGLVGGAQIGCDYQFAPAWVLGIEGQAAWTSLKSSIAGSVTNPVTGVAVPAQFTATNDFLASATGRLGYSVFDRRLLYYLKGGAAWTSEKVDVAFTTPQGLAVDPNSSATVTGWTAGFGLEWAFAPSWSATLESDYYGFGGRSLRLTDPNASVTVSSFKDEILTVTAGLNYRF